MAPDNELNKKEKKALLIGVTMGIVGGMVANLWANFYFKFIEMSTNSNYWIVTGGLVIGTMVLAIIIGVLIQDIKKT
ncbi:MAG: hypothetical protein OS112_10180 [Methanoregula sp.]|nr:MAG: hypothetical protein OS112_10180 [Methanoregula sp.]